MDGNGTMVDLTNPAPELQAWTLLKALLSASPALVSLAKLMERNDTTTAEAPTAGEATTPVVVAAVAPAASPAEPAEPAAVTACPETATDLAVAACAAVEEREPAIYSSAKRSREEVWTHSAAREEKRARGETIAPTAETIAPTAEKFALQPVEKFTLQPKPVLSLAVKAEMRVGCQGQMGPAEREYMIAKVGQMIGLTLTKQAIARKRSEIAAIPAEMMALRALERDSAGIEEVMKWAEKMRALHN